MFCISKLHSCCRLLFTTFALKSSYIQRLLVSEETLLFTEFTKGLTAILNDVVWVSSHMTSIPDH